MNRKLQEKLSTADSACDEQEERECYRFSYEQVHKLLQELYEQGKRQLREVDITYEYIAWLSDYEGVEYTYSQKQPTVHKALKVLEKKDIVKKVGKKFMLLRPDNSKEIAEKVLVDKVKLLKKTVFMLSITTAVIHPTIDTIGVAKKELYNYLGKHCYGIIEQDGFLIIMLNGKKETLQTLRDDLRELVRKIYDKQYSW